MRLRPLTWLLLSVMFFVTGAAFWWSARQQPANQPATPPAQSHAPRTTHHAARDTQHATRTTLLPPLRLSNTSATLAQLVQRPSAILLENALLDTAQPLDLVIPDHLRAREDPGAYILQSRAPLDNAFHARVRAAGAPVVAYIPNQAWLVRASPAAARQLQADPQTQALLPFQPWFKLKPPLLDLAARQQPLPETQTLNLLLFPDGLATALDDLNRLGLQVLAREPSPFGPVLTVRPRSADIPVRPADLARLPVVQGIELARARVFATDLSRSRVATATDTLTPTNYLGLTGTNVLVNVNDSGVDATYAGLQGRVLFDVPISGVDSNGHGTHVAGIIAGDGAQSATVTKASGSLMPAADFQFRGHAQAATLFALIASPDPGPASDTYLQETAAGTNAFISNNSWHYAEDNSYDLAAARYDAAVRDALPGVPGSQPLLFVFGAGNSGSDPDSIQSPATAKNVITVGAMTQPRSITNETWQCADLDGTNVCQTNQPWLALTATNDAVAAFSSRGNVGVGLEGPSGRFKPDLLAPGTFVVSARSTQWDQAAYYGAPSVTNNYSEVLSNLNEGLGPFYRYESGTSLAAANVSGVLALMQEFFQNLGRTNSPALMKALLINGARPLTDPGAFQTAGPTNAHGWGLVNLTNSLPLALTNAFADLAAPMLLADQDPAAALATGQSATRFLSLSPEATDCPLRLTLVWTDPPANPLAGVKLVNNLDLLVTNLITGEVFCGNHLSLTNAFSQPWDTNAPPALDRVNNVENVFLAPPLASEYSVTVLARDVNVNAVTARTNDVVQDYALVMAGGDGQVADALTLTEFPVASLAASAVTFVTNTFDPAQGVSGALLLNQRLGAQGPLLDDATIPWPGDTNGTIAIGLTNQWRFYVLTNDQDYAYAAFLTFLPPNLALPRAGVDQTNPANATRPEADLDLYVSTDPALTNLSPDALAAADKALSRCGTQVLTYSNVPPGALYYVGVKAEDQQAAQYAFMGVFSLLPFGEQDTAGSWTLRGINLPAAIPGGTPAQPGVTNVVAIAPAPIAVRRVVVTNQLYSGSFTNLLGTLSHGRHSAVLNNHSLPPGEPLPCEYTYVYEDNGEGDIPGSQPTDSPGSLRNFIGDEGLGLWLLTLANAQSESAQVTNLALRLDPQNVVSGAPHEVVSNAFYFDFLDVPIGATNLTLCLYNDSGEVLPLELYVRHDALPTRTVFDYHLPVSTVSDCLSVGLTTLPPLGSGRYYLGVFNPNEVPQIVRINASVDLAPAPPAPVTWTSAGPAPIPDDALTRTSLFVSSNLPIASLEVAVLVTNHPRVSDLVLTLISPAGTRVLLSENRGGATTNGLGGLVLRTNLFPQRVAGNFFADTNVLQLSANQGTLYLNYDFWGAPDDMRIYFDDALIYALLNVINTGDVVLPFGPGAANNLVITMNEGNNTNALTVWEYTPTVICPVSAWMVFTENTNLAPVPIKFASPPFLPGGTGLELYCLPEQPLDSLAGENAYGAWQLEVWDNRAGPAVPQPELVRWQLRFVFQNTTPAPLLLTHDLTQTNDVPPGQVAPFVVEVPAWATRATNILVQASAPVNLFFNQDLPPSGTNAGDFTLLSAATNDVLTLAAETTPSLLPGARYYLGVQNPNPLPLTVALRVDFDIVPLSDGVPLSATHPANTLPQYFSCEISTNATAASFQLLGLDGNVNLVLRQGDSLPTLTMNSYSSLNPGTNDEGLIVFTTSAPVPLTPGRWLLGVFNADPANVAYTVLVTAYTNAFPPFTVLADGTPNLTANFGEGDATDYYYYRVPTNAIRAQFEITGASGDMTLIARKGLPPPTLTDYACISANPGLNDELITLFDFSEPVSLTPGDWFISAVNVSGGPVSYAITATSFAVYGTNLVITGCELFNDTFRLTWTSLPGLHYFVQGRPGLGQTNWTTLSPTLTATEILTTYDVPLPSPYHLFRVGEGLVITPYTPPVTITRILVETNGVLLEWSAPTNLQFQAQWSPSLLSPGWTPFTNILTSTNGDFSLLDDGSQSGGLAGPRYYRLEQLP